MNAKLLMRSMLALFAGVLLCCGVVGGSALRTEPKLVTGRVSDSKESPIQGVTVQVFRKGLRIGQGSTQPDGTYRIELPSDSGPEDVEYFCPGFIQLVVSTLRSRDDQQISVMLRRNGELDPERNANAILSSGETLASLLTAAPERRELIEVLHFSEVRNSVAELVVFDAWPGGRFLAMRKETLLQVLESFRF